ncbi:high-affinity nicotinic acid transporter [Phyllosticta citriasiana]|uniref:high-affinity nicotinic acid transporter n=1 Tax=Phyllosticta citriasiana TaxID=595635 RepID=UPI0030FDBD0C
MPSHEYISKSPQGSETGSKVVEAASHIDPVKGEEDDEKVRLFAVGCLGILYMLANLDRSNIGNARIAGRPQDLGLTGNQYGDAVTLAVCHLCPVRGTCCPLYACRLLLGLFEAGLIPCINVYLGLVYNKNERGKRSSVIFAFSAVASAFGGILAYGLTQIRSSTYFTSWRALFIFEGALTLACAPLFFWIFPSAPRTAWFLNDEEKEMMKLRYELNPYSGIDEKFTWTAVVQALTDPKWYAFWVFQFCVDVSLYGFTTFLPSIIQGLGFSSVNAQLMTVPVYFWGACTFLFTAYMSDRTHNRGYWIAWPIVCLIIGYAILISVDSVGVRYFACFMTVMGIYPTTGMSMMWLQDNAAQHFKRATMVGGALTLGNTAGVAVGQIFTTESGPRFIKGLSISLGLAVVALAMVASLMVGMAAANRRRAAQLRKASEAGRPIRPCPEKGDMDLHFVYGL